MGTGVGGIAFDGRVVDGRNAIAGEWGHTPLPWPRDDERPEPACYCGRFGCLETWLCGKAFARGLAVVVDVLDPDASVLGGGVSNADGIIEALTERLPPYVFSDSFDTRIVRAMHGDSSGLRGAALLWPKRSSQT